MLSSSVYNCLSNRALLFLNNGVRSDISAALLCHLRTAKMLLLEASLTCVSSFPPNLVEFVCLNYVYTGHYCPLVSSILFLFRNADEVAQIVVAQLTVVVLLLL